MLVLLMLLFVTCFSSLCGEPLVFRASHGVSSEKHSLSSSDDLFDGPTKSWPAVKTPTPMRIGVQRRLVILGPWHYRRKPITPKSTGASAYL
ncbi:hypothetical protein EV126DRAFT_197782 [Verticillium dahliae]|nr:hypothetical protein EV126DRAFT_203321 [Verticillium dahliae]KAH6704868.1 hypothetical protein EV126DRAFT_197782 [Verticillium dahliae]